MKPLPPATIVAAATLLAALAGGCGVSQATYAKTAGELTACRAERDTLKGENAKLQAAGVDKDKQIATLQGLGDKRLDVIFHVARIELGHHTGGVDLDDVPGDNGFRVYLEPIDQTGTVIKAAGSVQIELFDLAKGDPGNRIGSYQWSVEDAATHWTSFVVYYYKFDCLWQAGPPQHDEITVRVTFIDYLTGKTFTAQKACKVALPAPSSQPAK